jgi:hypothetical protein
MRWCTCVVPWAARPARLQPDRSALAIVARDHSTLEPIPGGVQIPLPAAWHHEEFLLVRPDQHVAWRGPDLTELDLSLATGSARVTVER